MGLWDCVSEGWDWLNGCSHVWRNGNSWGRLPGPICFSLLVSGHLIVEWWLWLMSHAKHLFKGQPLCRQWPFARLPVHPLLFPPLVFVHVVALLRDGEIWDNLAVCRQMANPRESFWISAQCLPFCWRLEWAVPACVGRFHEEAPASPTPLCPLAGFRFSFFIRAQSLSWHGAQVCCCMQRSEPTTYRFSLCPSNPPLSLSCLAQMTLEKRPSVQSQHTAHVPVRLFVVQLYGGGGGAGVRAQFRQQPILLCGQGQACVCDWVWLVSGYCVELAHRCLFWQTKYF